MTYPLFIRIRYCELVCNQMGLMYLACRLATTTRSIAIPRQLTGDNSAKSAALVFVLFPFTASWNIEPAKSDDKN
jgi:hypothetical protein